MKLTFLGTGSAFTVGRHNYNSNMLLASGTRNFLIDCGSDARHSLHELGFSYRDIDDVYVSHLHADHAGGLEWLSLAKRFDPADGRKCDLYVGERMVDDLWNKVLAGGLSTLEGEVANLATYFNIHAIPEKGCFDWQGSKFELIQTVHIMSGNRLVPTYGLFFSTPKNLKIFVTTDTRFIPERMMALYQAADLIFHDCETSPIKSGVHARYEELLTLSPEIKKKMWLYHYNPFPLPDAHKDGFAGFVQKGQYFEL